MRLVLQEISRRELRKALERQGVTSLMEEEVLVLCDSLDPERRGRVRLSDVRDSLDHALVIAGRGSEGEVCTTGGRVAAEVFVPYVKEGKAGEQVFHVRRLRLIVTHTQIVFSSRTPFPNSELLGSPFAFFVRYAFFLRKPSSAP